MNTRTLVSACAIAMFLVVWGIRPPVLDAQSLGAVDPSGALESSDTANSLNTPGSRAANGSVDAQHLVAGSLGTASNAVDAWSVHCPFGTHHMHFDLFDFSPGGPSLGILSTGL